MNFKYNEYSDLISPKRNGELSDIQKSITNLIVNDAYITQTEIAKELGLSRMTISRNIDVLKEKNIIERIGSNKNGQWKIC